MTARGLNFRGSAGFVTDGAGQTYVTNGDFYPTNRDGLTFGFDDAGTAQADGDSGADPRLAGIVYQDNNGTAEQAIFRWDVTNGTYRFRTALGYIAGGSGRHYLEVLDDATLRVTVDLAGTNGTAEFVDATSVLRTSAADWIANNALSAPFTISSGILRLKWGAPVDESNATAMAHFELIEAGPSAYGLQLGRRTVLRRRLS